MIRPLAPVDRYVSLLLFKMIIILSNSCLCDGIQDGFVKLLVNIETQKILGCTIVAPNAGDMITEITICMQYDLNIVQLAGVIHPYPTVQEAIRQCALQYYQHYKDPNSLQMKTLQLYMIELEKRDDNNNTSTSMSK